ncbi:MAG: hypothetical protein CVV47_12950 [Spirochaetae bacterium HGW-Spirochaetae-3]|jgi:hypothetical protein|nr:MAG: hypothetical protein CVV47_12950 [Spirochaetae bacterium HGW-Spirochaetae-3]
MFRYRPVVAAVVAVPFLAACIPVPNVAPFAVGDMRPPAVASWGPTGDAELAISFDEDIAEALPGFASSPGPAVVSARIGADGRSVVVSLGGSQEPGTAYAVSGIVADAAGNLSSFVLPYWGHNPRPPALVFNELLTEGSATHPDAAEFYVAADGECAGLAFFCGAPMDFDFRYVFPPLAVEEGDYIVLHLKPQGLESEIDESSDRAASGGLDATAGAWDLWYRGGDGALSGQNGALSLCASPNGAFVDAALYSSRTIDSDTAYGGFGSAALRDRVGAIVAGLAWAASDPPRPEDCAGSAGTTSTRSLCRSSSSADTDSREDWHIVPTRGSTIGSVNSDEVYAP